MTMKQQRTPCWLPPRARRRGWRPIPLDVCHRMTWARHVRHPAIPESKPSRSLRADDVLVLPNLRDKLERRLSPLVERDNNYGGGERARMGDRGPGAAGAATREPSHGEAWWGVPRRVCRRPRHRGVEGGAVRVARVVGERMRRDVYRRRVRASPQVSCLTPCPAPPVSAAACGLMSCPSQLLDLTIVE